MIDLQELITRGRFVFADAPQRLKVFELVNGKRNTGEIARACRRHINNISRDMKLLSNSGLVQPRFTDGSKPFRINGLPVYEKVSLARTIPIKYFSGSSKVDVPPRGYMVRDAPRTARTGIRSRPLQVPTETEILDICKHGEDQIYEFKAQGVETDRITREVGAMLNTAKGGLILYGVEDDGTIQGAGTTRQKFDQPLQNSIRNRLSPAVTVRLCIVKVVGSDILVIVVPPWNRRDVYYFDVTQHRTVLFSPPG